MPRVHRVNKARKAYKEAGIKKGDTYYWWEFRYGGKHRSLTPPRPSQLTSNGALSSLYAAQETGQDLICDFKNELESETGAENKPWTLEELKGKVDELVSIRDNVTSDAESARDEINDSLENMPEQLRESSDTGQQLQERYDAAEDWINELEGFSCDESDLDEDDPEQARQDLITKAEELEEAIDRLEI